MKAVFSVDKGRWGIRFNYGKPVSGLRKVLAETGPVSFTSIMERLLGRGETSFDALYVKVNVIRAIILGNFVSTGLPGSRASIAELLFYGRSL